jgi:hypothetical protein
MLKRQPGASKVQTASSPSGSRKQVSGLPKAPRLHGRDG